MKAKILGAAALLTALSAAAQPAGATLIGFDDLTSYFVTNLPIQNPYDGFNWNNVYVLAGTDEPGTGFQYGVVSPSNEAFGGFGGIAGFSPVSGVFTLNSAYFTAGDSPQDVTVAGFDSSSIQLDSVTFSTTNTGPTLETFNWTGLSSVTFVGTGGHVVIDNLTVNATAGGVPEMSTWAMILAG